MFERFKVGEITIEVKALKPEKILNALWDKGIYTGKVIKLDMATIKFTIKYNDYNKTIDIIKKSKGKFKVTDKGGMIAQIMILKRRASLIVGAILFLGVIYGLSNYIWAIDIETKNNISPFQVRQQLESIGIRPGLKKSSINVYEIEKKMENVNDEIMWIRTRIEGSTLKLVIEEKVNPPSLEKVNPNEVVAKMAGEVQRVYTYSGNAAVKPGDIVKEGDTLILSTEGREGFEKEVKPSGVIIANTFYEKSMEAQISGEKLTRTGKKNSEVYLKVFGKKIYLKKCIDGFKYYDKIEENNGIFNKIIYFEKKAETIDENRENTIAEGTDKLEKSLVKTLSNDAKIVDRKSEVEDIENGKILIKVIFTVEQDIANNVS